MQDLEWGDLWMLRSFRVLVRRFYNRKIITIIIIIVVIIKKLTNHPKRRKTPLTTKGPLDKSAERENTTRGKGKKETKDTINEIREKC